MTGTGAGVRRQRRLIGRSLWHFLTHDVLTALLAAAAAVVVWWTVTLWVKAQWLPGPVSVGSRMVQLFGDPAFRSAFLTSLAITAGGFVVAVVLGGLCGLAMAVSRIADLALRYYVDAVLLLPTVVLAPVFVVVFGITSTNVFMLTVIYAFGIITLTSAMAVRNFDRSWLEVGTVFGANKFQLVTRILLRGVLPEFFGGLHLGIARAYKGMVVGQVFLGVLGIGAYEAKFQQAFDSAGIWSIAVILIAMALLLTWTVKAADHVVNYWAYRD